MARKADESKTETTVLDSSQLPPAFDGDGNAVGIKQITTSPGSLPGEPAAKRAKFLDGTQSNRRTAVEHAQSLKDQASKELTEKVTKGASPAETEAVMKKLRAASDMLEQMIAGAPIPEDFIPPIPKPKQYTVLEDRQTAFGKLYAGKVIDEINYNIKTLKSVGVKLAEVTEE